MKFKRRFSLCLFSLFTLLLFSSCGECKHKWKEASCTFAKQCELCGETVGEPLGHDWKDATCTQPKTCRSCGRTEGETLEHKWKDADCENPKFCTVCGKIDGKPLGHNWEEATCLSPKTCSVCHITEGEKLKHKYDKTLLCTQDVECLLCGTTIKQKGHEWKDADCENPKTCMVCGATEGKKLGHQWKPADCENPKTCTVCGETEGDKREHKFEYEIIEPATVSEAGKRRSVCKYCGEKELSYSESYELSEAQFKAACKSYSFDQISRNPDQLKNTGGKYRGEVLMVLHDGNKLTMLVNITYAGTYLKYWTDSIKVYYTLPENSSQILEGDVITIWGVNNGITGITGTPVVYAKYIK